VDSGAAVRYGSEKPCKSNFDSANVGEKAKEGIKSTYIASAIEWPFFEKFIQFIKIFFSRIFLKIKIFKTCIIEFIEIISKNNWQKMAKNDKKIEFFNLIFSESTWVLGHLYS
jgi:hypothetical protein